MLQDRNIHRDAQALRKSVAVPLIAPTFGVDQDEPLLILPLPYNWRLSNLYGSFQDLSVADLIVKAQGVQGGDLVNALGSPQLGQGSGVTTFTIEEFHKRGLSGGTGTFTNVAAAAAISFAAGGNGIATVLDGFWGVWLVQVNQSNDRETVAQAPIMAFATEAEALRNCPAVRNIGGPSDTPGRCAILTVQAVGGDFIAGTTNTDAALVAAFNTAPQDGHVMTMTQSGNPSSFSSVLGQQLKDPAGLNILQGKGSSGLVNASNGANGDLLCLSVRSAGAPVIVGGLAILEFRPWPAGGEGVGDASVSQVRPSFVP